MAKMEIPRAIRRTGWRAAGLFALLLGAAGPAKALSDLTYEGGLHLLINTREDSAPSPILPGLGASLSLWHPGAWRVEGGVQLFGTYYEYVAGRAVPAEIEQREFLVLALLGDLRLATELRLNDRFAFGGSTGLGLLLRLPIPLDRYAREVAFKPMMGYLYDWRFIYPQTGMYTRWKINERLELLTTLRVSYPIFHLWDGEELPFADQMIFSGLVGLRFTPRSTPP
jgi:hypothetical protein